jgi:hypothetical protein
VYLATGVAPSVRRPAHPPLAPTRATERHDCSALSSHLR